MLLGLPEMMLLVVEEATDVVEAAAAAAAAAEVNLLFECGPGHGSMWSESEFFVAAAGAAKDDDVGNGIAVHSTAEAVQKARGRSNRSQHSPSWGPSPRRYRYYLTI